MENEGRGQLLKRDQAHIRAVRQKLDVPTHQNIKIPSSQRQQAAGNSKMAIIDQYLSGKELPKEVEKHSGALGVESMRHSYAEILKISHQSNIAVSNPKQRLIDSVLARRSIEQFDKKEHSAEVLRKLNEEKEKLKKELIKLQLQMKNFTHASPRHASNKPTLQSRIVSTAEHLPDVESSVQNLREKLYKEAEARLRPYPKKSMLPGAEPHPLEDIHVVQVLLNKVVEEVLDDYLRRLPVGMDPETADQLYLERYETFREKISSDRALQLIAEQLVLETTLEMARQVADEVFIVNRMGMALGFDLIINSIQRTSKSVKTNEKSQDSQTSEELTGILLQRMRERDLYRKEVWKHTLLERPRTK